MPPTKELTKEKFDLDAIIKEARGAFTGKEKGLGCQISTGADISRPTKDTDFICYPNSHWELLTGLRGIPFGKVVQIAGKPDSGKTSHAMAFMKQAQDQNVLVIFLDVEGKFSPVRFDKYFKGSSKDLIVISSKMILEGGDMITHIIDAAMNQNPNTKILVVWDSVGGSLAANESDRDLREGHQMAAAAKENGQFLRGFINTMEKYKNRETNEDRIAILLINQVYQNIGSVGTKEAGGNRVEFHSSLILQLTRKSDLTKVKDKIKRKIGIVTRARVKKNHLFDGEDSVAELDLLITAGGIRLATDAKLKDDDEESEELD